MTSIVYSRIFEQILLTISVSSYIRFNPQQGHLLNVESMNLENESSLSVNGFRNVGKKRKPSTKIKLQNVFLLI